MKWAHEPFKVQLFWEGHKNVRNRPYGLIWNLLSKRHNHEDDFLVFSERLNFKILVLMNLKNQELWEILEMIVLMKTPK